MVPLTAHPEPAMRAVSGGHDPGSGVASATDPRDPFGHFIPVGSGTENRVSDRPANTGNSLSIQSCITYI
jgi:hypothetical protein